MTPAQYYKGNGRWGAKADVWVENQLARSQQERDLEEEITDTTQQTLTSGFNRDILRLTPRDVKFLRDCGVAAE